MTSDAMDAGVVEVTKAHRDLAAEIYRRFRYGATVEIQAKIRRDIERGHCDNDPIVQLLATSSAPDAQRTGASDAEAMREAFEVWAKPSGHPLAREHGQYVDKLTHVAWCAWKAAFARAAAQPQVGEGYVLVPREPTGAMLDAIDYGDDHNDTPSADIYRMMIAAAPTPGNTQ